MEFFPDVDELEEGFENKFGELQDYIVRKNRDKIFNKYLKKQDDIIEILKKNNIDNAII